MTARAAVTIVGWQVRETFRHALATRTFWLMLAVSSLCVVFCLGTRIENGGSLRPDGEIELYGGDGKPLAAPNPAAGKLGLGFGLIKIELFRDGRAELHFIQVLLAKWVAGAAGTLLVLVWTAGFLPEFLHSDAAAVLLSKPVPRAWLLLGKSIGVLAFVTFHISIFVLGTWAALGMRTGFWMPGYLLSIPLLILNFVVVFGASTLLAVCTRNTATCIFGSLVFWLVCFGMNYGRHAIVALPQVADGKAASTTALRGAVEAGYWFLPKPADLNILLDRALATRQHFRVQAELSDAERRTAFHPVLSTLSSLLFLAGLFAVSARQLATTDY